MINPPDDLLADLQSALPPEQQTQSPLPSASGAAPPVSSELSHFNGGPPVNGHASSDHLYNRTEHPGMSVPPERASVASTVSQVYMHGVACGKGRGKERERERERERVESYICAV